MSNDGHSNRFCTTAWLNIILEVFDVVQLQIHNKYLQSPKPHSSIGNSTTETKNVASRLDINAWKREHNFVDQIHLVLVTFEI